MASEALAVVLTAAELRDAVPTDWVLESRLLIARDEEELDVLPAELEAVEVEVEVDAVAVEPLELELSLLPPLAEALPPPPLDEPLERPPPLRVTETVMEVESPELLMLTDIPCRCPAICGAFNETYRSAAVTPVRRNVRSTRP
jgi:hypothetical protein